MNYNNQSVRFVWLLNTSEKLLRNHMILTRACLKKAFRELRVPVCGRVYPNEGGVAGYGNQMRVKYTAKWGLQIAEMIFQTRSSTSFPHFYIKATNMPRGILLYRAAAYCKIKIGPLDDY